jgi:hypothetical protein
MKDVVASMRGQSSVVKVTLISVMKDTMAMLTKDKRRDFEFKKQCLLRALSETKAALESKYGDKIDTNLESLVACMLQDDDEEDDDDHGDENDENEELEPEPVLMLEDGSPGTQGASQKSPLGSKTAKKF